MWLDDVKCLEIRCVFAAHNMIILLPLANSELRDVCHLPGVKSAVSVTICFFVLVGVRGGREGGELCTRQPGIGTRV